MPPPMAALLFYNNILPQYKIIQLEKILASPKATTGRLHRCRQHIIFYSIQM